MKRWIILLLLLYSFFCIPVSYSFAEVFYCDPIKGDTETGDGSADDPWGTLESVFAAKKVETYKYSPRPYEEGVSTLSVANEGADVSAGDILLLLDGHHGDLVITQYYNTDWITIKANDGDTPTLGKLEIKGGRFWRVEGITVSSSLASTWYKGTILTFKGDSSWGGPFTRGIIKDCTVFSVSDISAWDAVDWEDSTSSGIAAVEVDSLTIDGNTVKNISNGINIRGNYFNIINNTVDGFCADGIRGGPNFAIIENNTVKNSYFLHNDEHCDGIQFFTTGGQELNDVTIRKNLILHYDASRSDIYRDELQGIYCSYVPCRNWIVKNNIVMTDFRHGMSFYGMYNSEIINNTVVDINPGGGGTPYILLNAQMNGTPSDNVVISNNISPRILIESGQPTVIENNNIIYDSKDPYTYFYEFDEHDDENKVILKEGSPAIDAGSSTLAPSDDFVGTSRPLGGAVDVGALEFQSAGPPPEPTVGSLQVTIDPSDVRTDARWRLTAGPDTNWKQHNESVSNIPTGSYTLQFHEVTGWIKPQDKSVTISEGSNTDSGIYTILEPVLLLNKNSIDFGNKTTGTNTDDTFTISNTGDDILNVSSISSSNETIFSVSPTTGTVNPGGNLPVTVTFSPIAAQSYSETITVTSDGGTGTVTLSGSGSAPIQDTHAPIISSVIINPNSGTITNGDEVIITVTGTDEKIDFYDIGDSYDGSGNYNFRLDIRANDIDFNGNQVRVTLSAHSTNNITVTGVYLGEKAISGDSYDMESGTITEITFNGGNSGTTVLSGIPKVSDWIEYAYDEQKDYIVSIGVTKFYRGMGGSDRGANVKLGAAYDAGTANVTSYSYTSSSNNLPMLNKFEVKIRENTGLISSNTMINGKSIPLTNQGNGTFIGTYTVQAGDNQGVNIEATNITLTDAAGNESEPVSSIGSTLSVNTQTPGPAISLSNNAIDFGTKATGTSTDDTFTISNTGNTILNVSNISSNTEPIFFVSPANGTVNPDGSMTVTVTFSPVAVQSYSGTITITSDGGTGTVTLNGTVPAPVLALNKNSIDFGPKATGTSSNDTFTISNTGDTVLNVSNISSSNGSIFSVSPTTDTVNPGGSMPVTVTFSPVAAQGYSGTITVTSDGGTGTVTLNGTVPAPVLTLNKNSIDFGSKTTGTSSNETFTISNTGNVVLNVSNISSTTEPIISVNPTTGTVNPEGSLTVTVTFSPVAVQSYSGTIAITSDGGPGTVTLNGAGSLPKPVLALDKNVINFGSKTTGTSSNETFTISNTGDAVLNVSDISSSNGSILSVSTTTGTVDPGNSMAVTITFSPGAVQGYSETVTITSDGGTSTVIVIGTGTVVPTPFLALSTKSIDFGSKIIGTSTDSTFTITNSGDAELDVSSITSNTEPIFFVSPANGTINPEGSLTVTVTFSPVAVQSYSGTITITSDGGTDTITVNGTGTSAPTPVLALNTNSLEFGSKTIGTSADLTFTITNTGGAILDVSNISSSNGTIFSVSPTTGTVDPDSSMTATVTFSPGTDQGYSGTITVTSDGGTGTVTVSGNGTSAPTPVLALNTNSIDFGSKTIGTIVDSTFTITNSGDATLNVSDISSSNGSIFSVSTTTGTVDPGNSLTITVTFSPSADQSYSGTITVTSNGGTGTVTVSGTGTSAPTPVLAINTNSIDFGSKIIGTSADSMFTITNSGDAVLNVSNISSSNGSIFSVSPTTGTVDPGNSLTATVTFSPVAVQNYSGTITVTSDGGTWTVTVSGTGTSAPTAYTDPTSSDFNSDGRVDFLDFTILILVYGKEEGQSEWDSLFDLNSDSIIDINDFYIFNNHYGYESSLKIASRAIVMPESDISLDLEIEVDESSSMSFVNVKFSDTSSLLGFEFSLSYDENALEFDSNKIDGLVGLYIPIDQDGIIRIASIFNDEEFTGTVTLGFKYQDVTKAKNVELLSGLVIDNIGVKKIPEMPEGYIDRDKLEVIINDLVASNPSEEKITLRWTSPAVSDNSNPVSAYQVELGLVTPQGEQLSVEKKIDLEITPQAPGNKEEVTISGLKPGYPYYITVNSFDQNGIICGLSNSSIIQTLISFVDEDLDSADPFITRGNDSLFVADNDESITFVWSSLESLGASDYEVTVRNNTTIQVINTIVVKETSFTVEGEPEQSYSLRVVPLNSSGDRLGTFLSRPILCMPGFIDKPGTPVMISQN